MNEKDKFGFIIIPLIFIAWLISMIGDEINSEILPPLGWLITFIIGYYAGNKLENFRWRGIK